MLYLVLLAASNAMLHYKILVKLRQALPELKKSLEHTNELLLDVYAREVKILVKVSAR